MKSIAIYTLAALFTLMSSISIAQEAKNEAEETPKQEIKVTSNDEYQTLFNEENKGFGGYLGLNSRYTQINNQDAILLGGEINAVVNHSFNIGLKGYGMVTTNYSTQLGEYGQKLNLGLGYGGLNLEPVLFYNSVVHLTLPVLMGAGGIVEYEKNGYYDYHHHHNSYYDTYSYDYFFLIEPGVNLELNVLKFMRFSTGVSYRVTSDIKMDGLSETNLNGFNFDLSLKFGWF